MTGRVDQVARRTGLREITEADIVRSPAWHALRSTVVAALEPFPEAKIAVAAALMAIDERVEST